LFSTGKCDNNSLLATEAAFVVVNNRRRERIFHLQDPEPLSLLQTHVGHKYFDALAATSCFCCDPNYILMPRHLAVFMRNGNEILTPSYDDDVLEQMCFLVKLR